MVSGAAAQFLASPTDLVKIKLQTEGKRILEGHKPRFFHEICLLIHHKDFHSFPRYKGTVDVFRSLLAEGGVLGLWKGWVPNCQRAAVVCLGGKIMHLQVELLNIVIKQCIIHLLEFLRNMPMSLYDITHIAVIIMVILLFIIASDLTTYDTAKQTILRNTNLKDNAITHSLSRLDNFFVNQSIFGGL